MNAAGGGSGAQAAAVASGNNSLSHNALLSTASGATTMPMAQLADGWLELESDPGLFTLLLKDFGCNLFEYALFHTSY